MASNSSLLSVPGVEEAMNNSALGIVVTVTRESLLVLTVQCLVKEGQGMHLGHLHI